MARRGDAGTENLVVVQSPLHPVVIEDHPRVEGRRDAQKRRCPADLSINGKGIAPCLVAVQIHKSVINMSPDPAILPAVITEKTNQALQQSMPSLIKHK